MNHPLVEIREATDDDAPAVRAVWAANGDDVPEGGVDIVQPYLVHLLTTGRVMVAVDSGGVIGFAATVERTGVSHRSAGAAVRRRADRAPIVERSE